MFYSFYYFCHSSLYTLQFQYYTSISMSRHWSPGQSRIFYIKSFGGFISLKTFSSLKIKFLTVISFALDTLNKIWLSALNISSKPTPNLHSILMFFVQIRNALHFSILNLNFQIYFQFDNLHKSTCLVSFDGGLTSNLTSSPNSFISDFIIIFYIS